MPEVIVMCVSMQRGCDAFDDSMCYVLYGYCPVPGRDDTAGHMTGGAKWRAAVQYVIRDAIQGGFVNWSDCPDIS